MRGVTFGMDMSPLRESREFRLLWGSLAVTSFGSCLTYVALPLQIKELTGSPLAVGSVGLAQLLPLVAAGLWGGALADALDRRRLALWAEAAQGLCSAALLAEALLPHPALWALYLVAACAAAAGSLQEPSLTALTPQVVAPDRLAAASALNSSVQGAGAVVALSVAGVLAATAGVTTAYAADVATFAVSIALLARLRPVPAVAHAARASVGSIMTGVRYALSRRDLLGTYAVDLAAMLLAAPDAVFPFLADDLGAPWALGLMYASFAVGALLVSATSGWAARVHRHGRAVVVGALGWGAAVAAAGLSGRIWPVLLCLVVAGGFDEVSGLFRDVLWNGSIPDELRGRLAGVELLSYSVGPTGARLRAGWAAAALGVRSSLLAGGLACVAAVGALALAVPSLLRYDDRTDPHAVAKRASTEAASAAAAAAASVVHPGALEHPVHGVAGPVDGQPHQVEPVPGDGAYRGPVVPVVAGAEQLRGEHGRR